MTGLEHILKYIQWLERFARPRLIWMTGKFGTVLIGLIVALMAIILILPLPPGGNFPPAVACAVLGLALAERDGVIVLIGLGASVAAIVAAWIVTVGFIEYLPRLVVWLRGIIGLLEPGSFSSFGTSCDKRSLLRGYSSDMSSRLSGHGALRGTLERTYNETLLPARNRRSGARCG